ncbi:DALR anticodon-binding domain-containing protein 3 [Leguminivora glycinivorella]|uniref:DALR anticodon-binding domain-containing protein 3 n=1 Tax=Leguminivora glycinivorella TaxID=1035111 RepID=UPI00200C50B7|nr:DALR anticodon-binding domain-containing protein 3 [Leguminivora glycinivorella]
MIENVLDKFSDCVFLFLTGESRDGQGLLVKRHSESLNVHGDFSFPNRVKSWHGYIDASKAKENDDSLLQCIGKSTDNLVRESQNWVLQINIVKEHKDRIHLFLDRTKSIRTGLKEALQTNATVIKRINETLDSVTCDPLCNDDTLTSFRLRHLSRTIQNLCTLCGNKTPIFVSWKSSSISPDGRHKVLCGAVVNAKTGNKENAVDGNEFIRLRQDEMTLIAQHKYGVRVSTDSKWKEFIANLGESAAIFELLQTKPSSAVKINFDCSSTGSSKGAAFILYNCARLETIVRTFNEKVDDGTYPPLPDFEHTDFDLLTQEDEWSIIFNFIMGFPSLINNSMDIREATCEFRPHQICGFLCSMVRVFSQYYRRVRILTEPRKHLLPVLYARIHMLKILNETLKICLKILNIKSVTQM